MADGALPLRTVEIKATLPVFVMAAGALLGALQIKARRCQGAVTPNIFTKFLVDDEYRDFMSQVVPSIRFRDRKGM